MPLSPMSFQILSPDQANPFGYGLSQGSQIAGQMLANALNSKRLSYAAPMMQQDLMAKQLSNALNQNTLDYAPQMSQQELMARQLANALSQNTLNYAPQMSQAELAIKRAQPGLIGAQTSEAMARVPLINAQTDMTTQQTKFLPLDTLLKAQQSMQQSSRFGGAYQLAKSLSSMAPGARQEWIAQNQDQYNQMLSDLGNKSQANLITPDIINKFIPGAVPQNAMTAGGLPPQMQGQPMFNASTPQQTDAIRLANQMAANKSLTTNATQRQLEGAVQVEGIMNDPSFQSQALNAAQFAGALGKGKSAVSALSQTNPKAYEDYLSFKNQTMILLKNRIKTLDQMGATDAQRQELEGLYSKTMDSLTSNPQQFITQLNNLGKNLDNVARSVQTSASPLSPVNRLKGYQPIGAEASRVINGTTYHKVNGQWLPVMDGGQ